MTHAQSTAVLTGAQIDEGEAPTVFLDKDGTLVENVPYNVEPDLIRLAPGAGEAIGTLARAGCRLVVISNQSGVARGLFPEEALQAVEARLASLIEEHGGALAGFYYCPHLPGAPVREYAQDCRCRKPGSGLLHRASDALGISLGSAWMVGDILDDIEAGNGAGCRTVLIDNGNETEWRLGPGRWPDVVTPDLAAAARAITISLRAGAGR